MSRRKAHVAVREPAVVAEGTKGGSRFHGETARVAPGAANAIRSAIRLAGGREVCFVCTSDEAGVVLTARVAARGDVRSVLALPGFANRGELLLHNHPSGWLEPSGADLEVAARLHDDGIGFAIIDNDAARYGIY